VFTACDSATRNCAEAVVVRAGKVPDCPPPDQRINHVTVADTGYAPLNWSALLVRYV